MSSIGGRCESSSYPVIDYFAFSLLLVFNGNTSRRHVKYVL